MNAHTSHPTSSRARSLVVAAGLAIAAFSQNGCDELNQRHADASDAPATRTTLRNTPVSAASREQQRREMQQEAADLQAGLESMNTRQSRGGSAGDADAPIESSALETLPARRPTARGNDANTPNRTNQLDLPSDRPANIATAANRSASLPDLSAPGLSGARTPEQRRADAVAELASQLRPDIAGAKDPLRTAMPLMGLELISPGSSAQYLDAVKRAVTPDQRRSLDSAWAMMRSMATDPNVTAGNPADVAQALRTEADRLVGPQGGVGGVGDTLALGEVAMCQRVDGFGRFTPLGSNAFFAGRPAAMILYTEIENFSQTSALEASAATKTSQANEAAKWNVELGQTVRLYYEADGSEQLVLPETIVRDGSRSKRHDFFLVQRIDLPRTLSVGNYLLKITVRDAGGGGEASASAGGGAMAERIVPIRIIADASAAGIASQRGTGATTSQQPSTGTSQPVKRGSVADRRP